MGTPDVAAATLGGLARAGFEVACVVTRGDKRRGRATTPEPSPVKAVATDLGLPVTERVGDVIGAGVDLGVVVAYGQVIRRPVLEAVPMVNVHFSLLPRWRGAAPVERAVLAGDTETGVCLMAVEEGLDTGGVYRKVATPIGPDETVAGLRQRLGELGTSILVDALTVGLGTPEPQRGEAIYAAKVTPDELRVDWAQPASQIGRVVRVGRAWTTWRGKRLLLLDGRPAPDPGVVPGALDGAVVGTGQGGFALVTVQPEGRHALAAGDWLRGARPRPGEILGS
ncbi:MAG TPA: methionyl-tRNA formyltransferase [Acidimicrobiales bacterium]|nr:methionyl-tRNA formyltransferase [Acidimicrobiales bacterium]